MSYVYSKVDDLEGTAKVGSKQCVALVQQYGKLPQTSVWKEGAKVLGPGLVTKGTAVATFVDGKYKSLPNGNHAGFLVSKDGSGIWLMDQWSNDVTKPKASKRYIRKKGKLANGQYIDPSNNADAYAVID